MKRTFDQLNNEMNQNNTSPNNNSGSHTDDEAERVKKTRSLGNSIDGTASILRTISGNRNFSTTTSSSSNIIFANERIRISIKAVTGKNFFVEVYEEDTIFEVKSQIQEEQGISVNAQVLLFCNVPLKDELTVKQSNLQTDAVVHLIIQLCGGPGLPQRMRTKAKEDTMMVVVCKHNNEFFFVEIDDSSSPKKQPERRSIAIEFNDDENGNVDIEKSDQLSVLENTDNSELIITDIKAVSLSESDPLMVNNVPKDTSLSLQQDETINETDLFSVFPTEKVTPSPILQDTRKGTLVSNRCTVCPRKLGLATKFICRCGQQLCSEHRYSDRHSCSFDFRAAGRETLERENPLIEFEKIARI